MQQTTDTKFDIALEAVRSKTLSIRAASSQYGIPVSTLRGRLKKTEGGMAIKAIVEPRELPLSVAWAAAESVNDDIVFNILNSGKFNASFDDGKPIGVAFVSDQHIGVREPTCLKTMREHAELIANTDGLYAALGGDAVNNHIKHRSAVVNAKTSPSEQFKLLEHYLSIFGEKIMVMVTGNHDHWTKQMAGVDMIADITKKNKICYAPHHAYITCDVSGIQYRICMRHQYRFGSQMNLCHTVKRMWEYGEFDFDIGCVGHHHEVSIETFTKHGLQRWACRPGAYQIHTDYASQMGFNPSVPACPTFVLYPGTRKIIGFVNVEDAAAFLKSVR